MRKELPVNCKLFQSSSSSFAARSAKHINPQIAPMANAQIVIMLLFLNFFCELKVTVDYSEGVFTNVTVISLTALSLSSVPLYLNTSPTESRSA